MRLPFSSGLAVRLNRNSASAPSSKILFSSLCSKKHLPGTMLSPLMPHQMFPHQYLDSNGYPIAYAHPGPPLASMSTMSLNNLTMKSVRVHRYEMRS